MAYGAVFLAAVVLPDEVVPSFATDELRVSIHLRHPARSNSGASSVDLVEPVLRELIAARARPPLRRCALLLASDRRLVLHRFKDVAARLGCRLLTSERSSSDVQHMGKKVEHGQDTGITAVQDVFLLSHGHVLIGTWGSSLTILISEMAAARYRGSDWPGPPVVIFCDPNVVMACLGHPLPLVASDPSEAWMMTSPGSSADSFGVWQWRRLKASAGGSNYS